MTMKLATLLVTWEDYDSEPTCQVLIEGRTTEEERQRLLVSLAYTLLKRYGGEVYRGLPKPPWNGGDVDGKAADSL